MNPLWWTSGGLVWWFFFEWLRGRPRYRKVSTQHFAILALLGLVVSIGGTLAWLLAKVGDRL